MEWEEFPKGKCVQCKKKKTVKANWGHLCRECLNQIIDIIIEIKGNNNASNYERKLLNTDESVKTSD